MRRGLMAWDAVEIPLAILQERVARLQRAMGTAGQDAAILYTNFIRSGAVSYLTAFSPYWADGVLLVPQAGEPLFATTLSKRVGSWIQSVKPVGDVVNSPAPGTVLGKRLAETGVRRVAILELDDFPAGLYDELSAALPGVEIVDGSESFAVAREHLDSVERRLLARASTIAKAALDAMTRDAANAGQAVGAVEKHARLHGAEEVYVAIAPDLDADRRFVRLSGDRPLGSRFAIRTSVAYKGTWVRHAKTYSRNERDLLVIGRADAWFEGFIARIDVNRTFGESIAAARENLPQAQLGSWMAEAPVGTRPLAVVASSENPSASLMRVPVPIVAIALTIDNVPWCGAGVAGLTHGKPA